jgi:ABC-type bacteriocin/lantibiotic exporter with double-glycine peptidase domain
MMARYVYSLFKRNKIDVSQVNSIFMVLLYLLSAVDNTLQYSQDTASYIGSIIDIQDYIDNLNRISLETDVYISKMNRDIYTGQVDGLDGKIEFKNVDLCFKDEKGNELCIMENFSYVIQAGEKIAITGTVGTGKSTLLKLILKLTYPTSGKVLLDDKNLPYDLIRKNVSYISQHPVLFNRTLYKNIVYGTDKNRSDVEHLMNAYNLQGVFGRHTLDSDVGKSGNKLSGGQKQMVVLLRAILRGSSIILLDEPTSSLDKDLKKVMMNLVFKAFRNNTVVMVTHDHEIVPMFSSVLIL